MDDEDYMDDRTFRSIEESRRQMMERIVPTIKINQPTFDTAEMYRPAFDAMDQVRDQLTRQAEDVLGTAIKGNARLQESMGSRLTAQAALQNLFPRPDLPDQLRASLDLGFKTSTIADYIARATAASTFSIYGPTIAEQLGTRIDTNALMGLTGIADTAGKIAEQWRLTNSGALSGMGNSIASIRNTLELGGVTASSAMARTLIESASALDAARVSALSQIDLAPENAAFVDEILGEDQDAAFVAVAIERRLIDRFKISRASAHRVVRVIIWLSSAAIMIGITQGIPILGQILSAFNDSLDLFSPREFSKKATKKLIPLPEDEEAKDEKK